ncbi:MAG: Gfo/Idh/MocA family oxidoreductase [Candidatus Omnitrophica bacterium]|nr:Gfo/Idh/MocA family oxidoreductase [Candidatus Omnitrophota bacterium]
MTEYLRLVNEGSINIDKLISRTYPISKVTEAFESLNSSDSKPLMVILDYAEPAGQNLSEYENHDRKVILKSNQIKKNVINIALIGAGNFAVGMHLPNITKLSDKYKLYAVMNKTGHKGKTVAQQYSANYVTTNYDDILNDGNVDLIMITTRHDSHSNFALKALEAGKNVLVEKPLAINKEQLEQVKSFLHGASNMPLLMVGFNRRFSKYAQKIKEQTDKRINPLFVHYRMNAGYVPFDHWTHEDGGRIVGECCHIIDLMTSFTGAKIKSISFEEMTPRTGYFSNTDNKSIVLKYEDGSVATIEYFAVGSKAFEKEYMEVHFDEKTIVMDDYKSLKGYGLEIEEITTRISQKGHLEELERLYETLKGNNPKWPIELWDMIQTTEVTLLLQ